jgi:hypothetical protein
MLVFTENAKALGPARRRIGIADDASVFRGNQYRRETNNK